MVSVTATQLCCDTKVARDNVTMNGYACVPRKHLWTLEFDFHMQHYFSFESCQLFKYVISVLSLQIYKNKQWVRLGLQVVDYPPFGK